MKNRSTIFVLLAVSAVIILTTATSQLRAQSSDPIDLRALLTQRISADRQAAAPDETEPDAPNPCIDGKVGSYPCQNVDLLARLPLNKFGAGEANDIWGWTDPETGREYALLGLASSTAFIDITDGATLIGTLPTHTNSSIWRDIKTLGNVAYIVSEASGHGMQVFDLTQLRDVTTTPVTFSETAHYAGFGNAHNIVINEDGRTAFGVGTNTCSGGLHMISLKRPTAPEFSGCFSEDGYTHDAQCVTYAGPDTRYTGRGICFNANEDTLTIVDVLRADAPVMLSRKTYTESGYAHQAWTTEDHHYLLMNDELDEIRSGKNTRTYIWDIADLTDPKLIGTYTAETPAIDHNLYIKGDLVYQANYRAGLRILDGSRISEGVLSEIGYFDIYTADDSASFNGAWSVYPFFDSGKIVVSGIEQGLFVLELSSNEPPPETADAYLPLLIR